MEKDNIMNTEKIGICDFDLVSTKQLCYYNFGVLLLSSYYLDRGIKPRLILNLSYDNLKQYDKIYIFKEYKTTILPIDVIDKYYSLPIEEYGAGFKNAPSYPDIADLVYTKVKTDIYRPLLYYIKKGGTSFSLAKDWDEFYPPKMIFYQYNKELIQREAIIKGRMLIYDDPIIFFTTEKGKEVMTKMEKGCIIKFVKPIRIGKVPEEFYEKLFYGNRFVKFKDALFSYEDDEYLQDFINWVETHKNLGFIKIAVKTKDGVRWFKERGGRIYGNYRFKKDDSERTNTTSSEEDISVRYEWFTTKRSSKSRRRYRSRASEAERRKYLPSEYEKRRKERWARYNAIRKGR